MDKIVLYLIAIGVILFAVKRASAKKQKEVQFIAQTIFGEAAGEPYQGRLAVANVIHNRFLSPKKNEFGRTYKEIIFKPEQFSSVGNKLWRKPVETPNLMTEEEKRIYNESLDLALQVLNDTIKDNTKGAVLYYNPKKARPDWKWYLLKHTVTIGNHKFYRYK